MSSSAQSADWGMNDVAEELVRKSVEGEPGAPPETLSAPTKKTAMLLSSLIFHFDGDRDELAENDFFRLLVTRLETYATQDAKQSGSVSQMRAIAGQKTQDSIDAGGLEWMQWVRDTFRPEDRHWMINMAITSPPPPEITGVGKSYTAYALIETLEMISDIVPATNNSTDPYTTVRTWGQLRWWLENQSGQKVFLWDEAAQTLMYDDQVSGKELAKLIRLLRKYNCHLILIGHTGRGIPKDVRRMIMFLQKQDQKSAVYGVGLRETEAEHMGIADVRDRIENIPETSVEYNDLDDEGEFNFEDDRRKEPSDYELVDTNSDEWDECRACNRTVGIDEHGFCPDHGVEDLDDLPDDLDNLIHYTHSYDEVRAHYHEIRALDPNLFEWLDDTESFKLQLAFNWLFHE